MQLIMAALLGILAIVLLLSKRWITDETLQRAANAGAVISTIATLLILAFYTASLPSADEPVVPIHPTGTSSETEYVGRVTDFDAERFIADAKITLEFQNMTQVSYTDSEGFYRFKLSSKSNISGKITVEADGYETYTRNITISPSLKSIEEIRLSIVEPTESFPEPSLPPLPTATPNSVPTETLSSVGPEAVRKDYGAIFYYSFNNVFDGVGWETGLTYTYSLAMSNCGEDNFHSEPVSFSVTSEPGEVFYLLRFGIFNRGDMNDTQARSIRQPSQLAPASYAVIIVPKQNHDEAHAILESCRATMYLQVNDSMLQEISLQRSKDGVIPSNADGVFEFIPEFFLPQ